MINDKLPVPNAPVFPVDRRTKRPLTPNGFKDATDDWEQIAKWRDAYPNCGWAMPTGEKSGVFVVDADQKNDGPEQWNDLSPDRPDTLIVETQNGGLHVYFNHTEGIRNSAGKLATGIDIRGDGGYVLVPPTDGYKVIQNGKIADAPEWLIEALTVRTEIEQQSTPESDQFATALLALNSLGRWRIDNYQAWVEVGMALYELGEVGLHLWDAWSQKSDKYKLGECAYKWRSFAPRPDDSITLQSLYHWASEDNPDGVSQMPIAPRAARPSAYMRAMKAAGWEFRLNEANHDLEFNGIRMSSPLRAVINTELREHGYKDMPTAQDTILAVAFRDRYHPVSEYLKRLTWDGEDHIARLTSYFNDKEGVFELWLKRWLVGTIARVEGSPRGQQNRMLVLDGPQGIGKSYFVQWLASEIPALMIQGPIRPEDKDALLRLMSVWIWEVAELGATFRKADRESLKFFISQTEVTVRKPYDRDDTKRPAMASFIGTINNEAGFLSDPTGSRRFMVATIDEIDWDYSKDVEVGQVWAQAHELFRQGESWNLEDNPAEARVAMDLNRNYEIEDPLEDYIMRYYVADPDETEWFTPTTEILDTLKLANLTHGNDRFMTMTIGSVLKKWGLTQNRRAIDGTQQRGWTGIIDRLNLQK